MRCLLLLCTVMCCSTLLPAQLDPVFGVKAGPVLSTGLLSGADADEDKSGLLVGFMIGGVADLSLSDNITLRTGLNIMSRGTKLTDDDGDKFDVGATFLVIPATFRINAGDLMLGAGPYIGFGIGGKIKDDVGRSADIEFGSAATDDWSGLEIGIGVQAGKMFGPVEVGIGVDFGITNNVPGDRIDNGLEYTIHTLAILISGVYLFGN